jgi:hypothetical protein
MMTRYHLHLRDFGGDVTQDEEGLEFSNVAAARDHALTDIQELLADAIKHGKDADIESIIMTDERGGIIASVPVVAALPALIVSSLKGSARLIPPVRLEEYRRSGDICRSMAEKADDPVDKMSWLKLAEAWLQMLPKYARSASSDISEWSKPFDENPTA